MKQQVAKWALMSAVAAGMCAKASADEVIFKNGDKLTGKVETLESGKLTLNGTVVGKVVIEVKNIKTFHTDGPVSIQMDTGRRITEKVGASGEGQVALMTAPGAAVEVVPLTHVKYVNFNTNWHGSITAGGAIQRGNTQTENVNLVVNANKRGDHDRINIDSGFLYGREHAPGIPGEHETANNWWVGGKYDYFFNPKFYGYVNARVERDLIAGIDLRLTPGVGAGYQWIDKPDFHFSTEAGVSYLYRSYSNDGSDESVALRFAYHVDKKINSHLSLQHNLEYFPGLDAIDNFYFNTDIGLRANINEHFYTEFKTLYKYDAQPAPGKGRSDLQYILGVGYSF